MGIGKSRITPSINVDDMLEKAEISHEIEAEKQDADKRLAEVREAKDATYSGAYPFTFQQLIKHKNSL